MTDPIISFVIPDLRTKSEANMREHPKAKARRVRIQRLTAKMHAHAAAGCKSVTLPCVVRLTRIAPRKLDSDNCSSSMKAIRDGIADWLEIDDGSDELLAFTYSQERGPYGVRVEVFQASRIETRIVAA